MAETVIIRRALPRDVDGVAALWEKLVAYHHALDSQLPAATARGAIYYGRRIIDRIDDPSACVLVAVDGQEIVGYALGFVVDLVPEMFAQEPSGFLADIYVETAHRRRGIGRMLVERMIAWFAEHDLTYWEWHVAALNDDAVAFWKALGGREVMLRMRAPVNGGSEGRL